MVQFKPIPIPPETEQLVYIDPPIVFEQDEQALKTPIEFKNLYKESDIRGFFTLYATRQQKKPYKWEQITHYGNASPDFYQEVFTQFKDHCPSLLKQDAYFGVKIVALEMDMFNPIEGVSTMIKYTYEHHQEKNKTYINGPKANKSFLAAKGKQFVTKKSV